MKCVVQRLFRFMALPALALICGLPVVSDIPAFTAKQRNYWAYQKVQKPAVPGIADRSRVKSPVDNFILAKLDAKGLTLAAPADKITLLRRATFDLTGLPPTPAEVQAFLADKSPRAFAKVVDRLLASPQYGEKWARHWLDLARYAESEGFKADETRPNAWRYRDYVIRSFNTDKPYDRFIKEQIAGDELWPNDPEALVATAFNRHYPDESNARNLMQRRQEILNDITDTIGSVFLATTVGCAKCHDHKYDPILQKDYYRLQSFFAATRAKDDYVLVPAREQAEYKQKRARWEEQTRELRREIDEIEAPAIRAIYLDNFEKYPAEIQAAINMAPEKRDSMQWLMYHKSQWLLNQHVDEDGKGIASRLKGDTKKRREELRRQLAAFDASKPAPLPVGSGMGDISAAPAHHVLGGGVYDAPKQEIAPGFPTLFDPNPATITPVRCEDNGGGARESTGRRTALATWLASADNPLTARVMVNRLWHYHFGRGIVGTPNDFGQMREHETHRELLDWLTATFVEQGWSIKKMHRTLMLSAVYQQATTLNETAAQKDPENNLLWRFRRARLSGEEIRDAMLSISGLLNPAMGGPSVFPEIPANMEVRGGWKRNESEEATNRRSVYVFVRRNSRYPMFQAFDMPDTHESCGRRTVTVTAPQALNLLNDKVVLKAARAFAGRVLTQAGAKPEAQIATAWRLALSRNPGADEVRMALEFMRKQAETLRSRVAAGETISTPASLPAGADQIQAAALLDLCHVLLNTNEFVYVN
ncbi:MAG: DUF1549 and DUF1553 domain-containing protein [Blastocatellia bacterium]